MKYLTELKKYSYPTAKRVVEVSKERVSVKEGIFSSLKCRTAKYGLKQNQEMMNTGKEQLELCKKLGDPLKIRVCEDYYKKVIRLTTKPLERSKAAVERYCKDTKKV